MTKAGERLIESMKEAVAIANGEQPAAAIWVGGFQYVPAREIDYFIDRYGFVHAQFTVVYREDALSEGKEGE